MSLAGVVIGLIFIIPGGIMLICRLCHRLALGEPWNNMPVVFTWAFAIGCAGVAVILTGLITKFTLKCEGGCQLEGGSTTDGTIVSGAIVAGIALCCGCCNRYRNEGKSSRWTGRMARTIGATCRAWTLCSWASAWPSSRPRRPSENARSRVQPRWFLDKKRPRSQFKRVYFAPSRRLFSPR